MIHMYKIAVLGDRQSVMGFAALGLSIFPVENDTEALNTLKALAKDEEVAIIYVTERLHKALKIEIEKYKDSVRPAVILIPDHGGSLGLGKSALQDAVVRAVGGADIL